MSITANFSECRPPVPHRKALVWHYYDHIASAVKYFPHSAPNQELARRRWTIGLYYEVVRPSFSWAVSYLTWSKRELRDALGLAVMHGAWDVRFLHLDFSWFTMSDEGKLVIHWDVFPRYLPVVIEGDLLSGEGFNSNPWWLVNPEDGEWNSPTEPPSWWNTTEEDLDVSGQYFHK